MNEFIKKYQEDFDKAIEFFRNELAKIRTGRANPALVENILVDAYGASTPLKQLATINIPEVRVIRIEPWDKTNLKSVQEAIDKMELGVSTSVDDASVRVNFPQMTEESRERFIKMIDEQLEKAKVSLRMVRDKVKDDIEKAFKNGDITEDDKYKFREDLDNHIDELNKQLEELAEKKRQEIMKI